MPVCLFVHKCAPLPPLLSQSLPLSPSRVVAQLRRAWCGLHAHGTVAGLLGMSADLMERALQTDGDKDALRVLCIGLGGGSLPLFLSYHFPGMSVEVAEIDPVVIRAAHEALCLPRSM